MTCMYMHQFRRLTSLPCLCNQSQILSLASIVDGPDVDSICGVGVQTGQYVLFGIWVVLELHPAVVVPCWILGPISEAETTDDSIWLRNTGPVDPDCGASCHLEPPTRHRTRLYHGHTEHKRLSKTQRIM